MIKEFIKKLFSDVAWVRWRSPYIVNIKNTKRKYYAKCGKHTQLFGPLYLDPSLVELDDYTRLQPGVRVISAGGKFVVKKYSAIGAGCTIIASEHTPTVGLPQFFSTLHINDVKATVVVEEDAWVGANSVLLSRSRVGRGAVVAAGSIVTKPVPPYAVVAGSPAKVIAARFTKEQLIKHETILYAPADRLPAEEVDALYATVFKDVKTLGVDSMSQPEKALLQEKMSSLGIDNYENGK